MVSAFDTVQFRISDHMVSGPGLRQCSLGFRAYNTCTVEDSFEVPAAWALLKGLSLLQNF